MKNSEHVRFLVAPKRISSPFFFFFSQTSHNYTTSVQFNIILSSWLLYSPSVSLLLLARRAPVEEADWSNGVGTSYFGYF